MIKRGATVLAQAATGSGGLGTNFYAGGPAGTNVYAGLSLTAAAGGAAGASGGGGCGSFPGPDGTAGVAGDKVTGSLSVTGGESLTVIVGTPGSGSPGTNCVAGGNGGAGSVTITW